MRSLVGIAGVALLLGLTGCSSTPAGTLTGPRAATVTAATTSSFVDLAGARVSLAKFAGKPIVLTFLTPGDWDSGAQLPHLIRLAAAYQEEGVVFVCAGEKATLADLRKFKTANSLDFPVWQDVGGREFAARGFSKVPAHQFISKAGAVVSEHQGFLSRGELLARIAQILE
jgi:peroxiredoxin